MSMVIPDAAPEVKRRALAYVLCFFLAFFVFSITVACCLAARRKRSRRYNKRIYILVDKQPLFIARPVRADYSCSPVYLPTLLLARFPEVKSPLYYDRLACKGSKATTERREVFQVDYRMPFSVLGVSNSRCRLQLLALLLAAAPRWTEDSYSFDSRYEPSLFLG
ncbi:hypothetical protein CPB85DRAFT_1445573 [Mucidula mucida]|nr:hypothetical protein CPB85DRAFT_1445573 [Mucidula mucida]